MIWLKRFAPLVVLGIVALGWYLWDRHQTDIQAEAQERTALITAQTWVKFARYAGENEAFLTWRDSMLAAEGIKSADLYAWLAQYEERPEEYLDFAKRVKTLVDSLAVIEDSLVQIEEAADTAAE